MAQNNFGVGFVLKSRPDIRSKKGPLINGILQVDGARRVLNFIRKCGIVHTIFWGDVYEVKDDPRNISCILLNFRSEPPCEIYIQSLDEKSLIQKLFQCIITNQPITGVRAGMGQIQTVRRGWCTKPGKREARRWIVVNNIGVLTIYKSDLMYALPSYIIHLNSKSGINPSANNIQVVGAFKTITLTFESERDSQMWVADFKSSSSTPLPPAREIQKLDIPDQLDFTRHTSFMPEDSSKRYLKSLVAPNAAPSGPSGHW